MDPREVHHQEEVGYRTGGQATTHQRDGADRADLERRQAQERFAADHRTIVEQQAAAGRSSQFRQTAPARAPRRQQSKRPAPSHRGSSTETAFVFGWSWPFALLGLIAGAAWAYVQYRGTDDVVQSTLIGASIAGFVTGKLHKILKFALGLALVIGVIAGIAYAWSRLS